MKGQYTDRSGQHSWAPKPPDEARLIELARRGDQRAIGELYSRHADVIYHYVYVRVKDCAVAEDLTGQVFLKAVEDLPTYRSTGAPFLAWLYRIAWARIADYWRVHYRHPEVPLAETALLDCADPDAALDGEKSWNTAIDRLAQLTDDQQLVIIMRFIGEMSLSEVASVLSKTTGAVKAIQHRALASLARMGDEQTSRAVDRDAKRARVGPGSVPDLPLA